MGNLVHATSISLTFLVTFEVILNCIVAGDGYIPKDCSNKCPEDHFVFTRCTPFADRVCKACRKCENELYQQSPCTKRQDRKCLHISKKMYSSHFSNVPRLNEVESVYSRGLFYEDLLAEHDLDTVHRVTSRSHQFDFFWTRKSGIKINIAVKEINILPTYVTNHHVEKGEKEAKVLGNDNDYILKNPNADKKRFQFIKNNYCRYPVPDSYTLTLEIYRDRTTAMRKCKGSQECQSNKIGVVRSLNQPCKQMVKGTYPSVLSNAANSVLCTKQSKLLLKIFTSEEGNVTDKLLRFPPLECRNADARCKQCLGQHKCRVQETFMKKCCQIDCYTLADCKESTSQRCLQVDVKCAMGDVYRYTIQPIFNDVNSHYQCHLKMKKPKIGNSRVLYKLEYSVEVPGYDSPTTTEYVKENQLSGRSTWKSQFIDVQYNSGLNLSDEFIIVSNKSRFTAYPLKTSYTKTAINVNRISRNIYVASLSTKTPFQHNSLTWTTNEPCSKDIDSLVSMQTHYNENLGQSVDMNINIHKSEKESDTSFSYQLKSKSEAPFIRFIAKGNNSILKEYFKDPKSRVEKFTSLLEVSSEYVKLILQGSVLAPPTYFSVFVELSNFDEVESVVVSQDILVHGLNKQYSIVYSWPSSRFMFSDFTFKILLTDSSTTFIQYHTYIYKVPVIESSSSRKKENVPSETYNGELSVFLLVLIYISTLALSILICTAILYRDKQKQLPCVGVLCVLCKLVYSAVFSYALLAVIISRLWHTAVLTPGEVGAGGAGTSVYGVTTEVAGVGVVGGAVEDTVIRQTSRACSTYLQNLLSEPMSRGESHEQSSVKSSPPVRPGGKSYRLQTGMEAARMAVFADHYTRKLTRDVGKVLGNYRDFNHEILTNEWLTFGKSSHSHMSKNITLSFLTSLGLGEHDLIMNVKTKLVDRFKRSFKTLLGGLKRNIDDLRSQNCPPTSGSFGGYHAGRSDYARTPDGPVGSRRRQMNHHDVTLYRHHTIPGPVFRTQTSRFGDSADGSSRSTDFAFTPLSGRNTTWPSTSTPTSSSGTLPPLDDLLATTNSSPYHIVWTTVSQLTLMLLILDACLFFYRVVAMLNLIRSKHFPNTSTPGILLQSSPVHQINESFSPLTTILRVTANRHTLKLVAMTTLMIAVYSGTSAFNSVLLRIIRIGLLQKHVQGKRSDYDFLLRQTEILNSGVNKFLERNSNRQIKHIHDLFTFFMPKHQSDILSCSYMPIKKPTRTYTYNEGFQMEYMSMNYWATYIAYAIIFYAILYITSYLINILLFDGLLKEDKRKKKVTLHLDETVV